MSVYKLFSSNLRDECLKFESIAQVCREIGINRQQFNKYLGGQSLPNQRTLAKLATFFNIPEEALFRNKVEREPEERLDHSKLLSSPAANPHPRYQTFLEQLGNRLERDLIVGNSPTLNSGYYFCYTPLEHHMGFTVRSLIKISYVNNIPLFVRRTTYSAAAVAGEKHITGKHHGIVLSDRTSTFFVGSNAVFSNEISVIKIAHTDHNRETFSEGIAMLHGVDNEILCKVCFQRLGDRMSIAKRALEELGVVSYSDPSIIEPIRLHMQNNWKKLTGPIFMASNETDTIKNSLRSQFQKS